MVIILIILKKKKGFLYIKKLTKKKKKGKFKTEGNNKKNLYIFSYWLRLKAFQKGFKVAIKKKNKLFFKKNIYKKFSLFSSRKYRPKSI